MLYAASTEATRHEPRLICYFVDQNNRGLFSYASKNNKIAPGEVQFHDRNREAKADLKYAPDGNLL